MNDKLLKLSRDCLKLKTIFDRNEAIKAVEQSGYALQYVNEQDKDICIKAVEQNGDALRYVNEQVFDGLYVEMTVSKISKILGFNVKIVK